MECREKIFNIYRKRGIEVHRLNSHEEIVEKEPFYSKSRIKSAGGFIFPLDSCIDTYDFSCRMHKKGQEMGVRSSVNCEFKNFIFKENSKEIQGVQTTKGIIPCDNIFICASYYSPRILQKLGLRLPIIPLKGYTFTQKKTDAHNCKSCLIDYNCCILMTQRFNTVRWTSQCTDIMGIDYTIPKARLARSKTMHDNLMNNTVELDESSCWTGMRPLSPDDVPILAKVPGFDQVIINTGHGSKGASTFITTSVLASQIFKKDEKDWVLNNNDYDIKRFWLL
jgi:D-amino-acid dehydrogenase